MVDKEPTEVLTKGLDNTHEILKQADTDDTHGMVKYSIDLDNNVEKLSLPTQQDTP